MPTQLDEPASFAGSFRLGEWLVEPRLNRLTRNNESIQIELKMMDVLVCLASHAGELVERQQLIDTVWATEFISENILTRAIAELRNVLGDDARNPSFIETIHRRGYRLIAPVEAAVSDDAASAKVARFPAPEGAFDDHRSPYPGLAAFTEDDAEFFFGRESEVAQLWRKITTRRLLAMIGPSGVGKSSLVRAGIVPAAPEGWRTIVLQPGDTPFSALARALAPEFRDDPDAIAKLVDIREGDTAVAVLSRWRGPHDHVLLVVDQFEELFTQNPPEIQGQFAALLRKVADRSDVNVLIVIRDDFLIACNDHDSLSPVFSDLSPIKTPERSALRRALVNPAAGSGYSFEDEGLVDEMLDEIEGEQAALPLLAFTVARLWEERNRERRLMTREAYERIGGVHGSLALHAENTLASVGGDRQPLVRELFRNLVTAQGTRAVREVDELLSVFDDRSEALVVLSALTDARLLNASEVTDDEGGSHRMVEIVHESLLTAWPRLVRWQTQDADAAQLRDQLRQAAKTWNEHGRPTDLLWTGSTYREFQLWRDTYPGGLSEIEAAFAVSMTSHATRLRRRRRFVATTVVVFLAAIASIFGVLWRRSVLEARRAEAANLTSLGQLALESFPTATVAYAAASLELADTQAARRLALEALWKGPTAFIANDDSTWAGRFTADGNWLVQIKNRAGQLQILGIDGTSRPLTTPQFETTGRQTVTLDDTSPIMLTLGGGKNIGLWSAPDQELLAAHRLSEDERVVASAVISDQSRALLVLLKGQDLRIDTLRFDGTYERLGTVDLGTLFPEQGQFFAAIDKPLARSVWVSRGHDVFSINIDSHDHDEIRRVATHDVPVRYLVDDPLDRFLFTVDAERRIRVWDLAGTSPPTELEGPPVGQPTYVRVTADGCLLSARTELKSGQFELWLCALDDDGARLVRRTDFGTTGQTYDRFDPTGVRVAKSGRDPKTRIWFSSGPADADPLVLAHKDASTIYWPDFEPHGRWLATADANGLSVWPLVRPYPFVIRRHTASVYGLTFGPNGDWLASSSWDGTVRLWPLGGRVPAQGHEIFRSPPAERQLCTLAATPDGESLVVGTLRHGVWLVPRSLGDPRRLVGFLKGAAGVSLSPDGRYAAATGGQWEASESLVRVWDVVSGAEVAVLEREDRPYPWVVRYTEGGQVFCAGDSGLLRWNLETGESEIVYRGVVRQFAASSSGRRLVATTVESDSEDTRTAVFLDLETEEVTPLTSHGAVGAVALDRTGTTVVTSSVEGIIRVGSVAGEEPHLLFKHDGVAYALAIDPLGRWIASAGQDGTVRIWPMPDLSKPPLHTLPREDLIAKLKTLTNLRVVRDPKSWTGWTLTHDPFQGWAEVPTW